MQLARLDAAQVEIARLLKAIMELRLEHELAATHAALQPKGYFYFNPKVASASKHTGAVKRASMDVTRVLVELRKPN